MAKRVTHPDAYTMSLGDHLEELRKRVFLALIAPIPLAVVIFFFSDPLIQLLIDPVLDVLRRRGLPPMLQTLYPAEVMVLQLKLSIIAALVVSFPWILWQLWLFIQPGLYPHERRFVYLLLPGSFILSILGTLLLYFVMLPLTLEVLISIGSAFQMEAPRIDPRAAAVLESQPFIEVRTQPPPELAPGQAWLEWPSLELRVAVAGETLGDGSAAPPEVVTIERSTLSGLRQEFQVSAYIDFVLLMLLGTVLAFQMPMVVMLLGWVGLASPEWLGKRRKYAILVCAFIAAIVTPSPDVISMLVMFVPLYGLYELGIILLRVFPARAVAEGPRWAQVFRTDKSPAKTAQLRRLARPEQSIARKEPNADPETQPPLTPPDENPTERGS